MSRHSRKRLWCFGLQWSAVSCFHWSCTELAMLLLGFPARLTTGLLVLCARSSRQPPLRPCSSVSQPAHAVLLRHGLSLHRSLIHHIRMTKDYPFKPMQRLLSLIDHHVRVYINAREVRPHATRSPCAHARAPAYQARVLGLPHAPTSRTIVVLPAGRPQSILRRWPQLAVTATSSPASISNHFDDIRPPFTQRPFLPRRTRASRPHCCDNSDQAFFTSSLPFFQPDPIPWARRARRASQHTKFGDHGFNDTQRKVSNRLSGVVLFGGECQTLRTKARNWLAMTGNSITI